MSPWWIVAIVVIGLALVGSVIAIIFAVKRYTSRKIPECAVEEGSLLSGSSNVSEVRHIVISLPYREKKFQKVQKALQGHGYEAERFVASIGKYARPEINRDEHVAKSFRDHLKRTKKHRGHFGATRSHMMVWRQIVEEKYEGPVAICEDDVVLVDNFGEVLKDRMIRLGRLPKWHVLFGGMSCSYDTYHKCHENDGLPLLEGHLYRVRHAIGLWYYVVNGWQAAAQLLQGMQKMEWMIDHNLSERILQKRKDFYAFVSVPVFALHPGTFEISSFKEKFSAPFDDYVSDTNLA